MTVEDVLKRVEFEEKWLLSAGYNAYNADIAFHTIKWAIKQLSTESENVGMCQQNVGEKSEQMPSYNSIKTELNGDLIHRKDVITMLNKIENAVEDGEGYQFNEWVDYVKELPTYSAEEPIKHFGSIECPNCGRLLMLEETYDWCNGCKEYDTEKHCCHRYSSFIRYSLQENINAVLEDIKTEIRNGVNACIDIINKTDKHIYPQIYSRDEMVGRKITYEHCLKIIDKHISGKEE